jgi:6-pyruvoyltetrahydropterin/6-carboxytetrahydropterin synthase
MNSTIILKITRFEIKKVLPFIHCKFKIVNLKSTSTMKVTISRKAHFNAAHRLYRKDWSMEKNDAIFGKCNNPNFHGHNYDLTVSVTGGIDHETGYVMDVKFLADIIKEEVEDKFDHKNLNLDVAEFKDLNPTAENIVVVIWNKIRKRINIEFDLEVVLYETPRNFVTYKGE